MWGKNEMSESNKIYNTLKESIDLQSKIMDNIFLLSRDSSSVRLIKDTLSSSVNSVALYLIKQFPEEMKVELLPNIIEVMRYLDGNTKICQDIILTLDREWLKNNIWNYSKHVFDDHDYQSIGIFIYLFNCIDSGLSRRLANFALESEDEDVRDIGEIYFEKKSKT